MRKTTRYPQYAVPRGEFTIVVRDAATGEIKRVQKEPNIVTQLAFYRYAQQTAPLNATTQRMGISPRIHGRQVSREVMTPAMWGNNITSPPTFSNIRLTEETMSTPVFSEVVQRFDVPPVNRTIFTIVLGQTGDVNVANNQYANPIAYANLTTPCTQSTTEILDIFYRVQLLEAPVDPLVEHPSHPSQPITLASRFVGDAGGSALTVSSWFAPSYDFNTFVNSFPQQRAFHWAPGFPDPDDFKIYTTNYLDQSFGLAPGVVNNSTGQGYTSNDPNSGGTLRFGQYYLVVREEANPSPTNVGQVIKNLWFGAGRASVGTSPDTNNGRFVSTHIVPAVPDNFTKVQPLHNHSALAITPFLDPSFLASGTGSIRLNADDWTNYSLPEYYRIDIGTTGDIPVSKYSFRQRYITGFVGNSYQANVLATSGMIIRNGEQGLVWEGDHHGIKHFMNNGNGSYNGTINRNGRAYYSPNNPDYEPDATVLSYDLTGVSLADLKSIIFYDFDSLTTPALPATSIRQVAVDSNGSIWVACGNTGLYRIDDPKGVPTVTLIPNPIVGGESKCFGVSIGKQVLGNDTIVAVFKGGVGNVPEGGIALSTDYGTTWPLIYNTASVPAFTFTGITNDNWANVYKVHVDKSTDDYKLGLVQSTNGGVSGQLVWWSQTYPAKAGPAISNMSTSVTDVENFTCWYENAVKVSDTNSLWAMEQWNGSQERPLFTRFYTSRQLDTASFISTNNTVSTGTSNGFTGGALKFLYDYYGNPFVAGFPGTQPIVNAEATSILTLYSPNNGNNNSQQNIVVMNNNTWLSQAFGNNANNQSGVSLTSRAPDLTITDPGLSVSVLNGRYRCTEEMVWNKYHWTGAVWQKNYFVDAVDSSLNSYSGTRQNFDTESHTFTGRSTIVVGDAASPRVATAGNWAADTMTFACRMTREAKLAGQTTGALAFTGFDKSRQYYITGVTTGLAGNWRISGNFTAFFTAGTKFVTNENTNAASNNAVWTVGLAGSSYSGITNETTIPVGAAETINGSATGAGYIYASIFEFFVSGVTPNQAQTGISQGGAFKQFGANAAATVSTPTNVLLTITGTTATLYHNGASVGSVSMDYPLRWDNPATQLEIVVGGRGRITNNNGFITTEQFFRGTLQNVIFSNIVWSAPQIAAHNASPLADPTTYGTPVPAANIIARYQLNEVINETKATHTTFDDLLNGIDIRFLAGASGTDFVATDYYTIGVVDGILKDNATKYNYRSKYYIMPVEHGIDTFTPATVPAVASTITERVCWRASTSTNGNDFFQFPAPVGECAGIGNKTPFTGGAYALGFQNSGGEITFMWKMEGRVTSPEGFLSPPTTGPDTATRHLNFYLATNYNTSGATAPNPSYMIMFRGDGTIQAFRITAGYEGSITESSVLPGTWSPGDTFGLVRTAGNVIEVRSGASLATLLFSFPTTNAQTMFPGVYQGPAATWSAYDAVVTYPRAAYFVDVGTDNVSPALRTGKFHPLFYNFDATLPRTSVAVSVDQSPIGAVDTFNNIFEVTGVDVTATFTPGSIIKVVNNTDPDTDGQVFTVLSSVFSGGDTEITVGDTPISGVYPTYIQVIPPTATATGDLWKLLEVIVPGVTVGTTAPPYMIGETHIGALPAPGVNQVVFVPENGNLLFNPAQAGKTIAGMFTILYKEPL